MSCILPSHNTNASKQKIGRKIINHIPHPNSETRVPQMPAKPNFSNSTWPPPPRNYTKAAKAKVEARIKQLVAEIAEKRSLKQAARSNYLRLVAEADSTKGAILNRLEELQVHKECCQEDRQERDEKLSLAKRIEDERWEVTAISRKYCAFKRTATKWEKQCQEEHGRLLDWLEEYDRPRPVGTANAT
jgi:predicted transcriptional regulator